MAGDGNAVQIHQGHRLNPAVRFQSLCIIDGDSEQSENLASGVVRLPGGQPERSVFDAVIGNLATNIALLTVACQLAPSEQHFVETTVNEVGVTNRDPHLLFSQLGIDLGFVPEVIIRGAFLSRWILENASAMRPVVDAIRVAMSDADAKLAKMPPLTVSMPSKSVEGEVNGDTLSEPGSAGLEIRDSDTFVLRN